MQKEIDLIRGKVLEMSALAQQALKRCQTALVSLDRKLAYSIILRDQRIDELEKEIDRLCLEFLVRQQPVAGPLRTIYVTIKINQELERIGDYCESIARQIIKLDKLRATFPIEPYAEIATISLSMLGEATRAFLEQNVELAQQTMLIEEKVDQLRDALNKTLLQLRQENKIPLEAFTPLATVARRYERISDQAKNICEEVLYMVTGEYAKHRGTDVYRILFLDDHNICGSQMAEGIANALNRPQLVFSSASLEPGRIDSATVKFMTEKGLDISRQYAKGIAQVPHLDCYQVAVALSPNAQKSFPCLPPKAIKLDWHITDPCTVTGSPEAVSQAFESSFKFLQDNIKDLAEAILGNNE